VAVTPTGSPAWTRTVSHVHYGGNTDKANYLGRGAIDPITDVAAEEFSRQACDLASVTRTSPFAVITLLHNDGPAAAPTIESVLMMTGVRLTSYAGDAAPTGFPSAARNGDGHCTITFSASYLDDYSVTGSFAPISGIGTGHGADFVDVTVTPSGSTVVVRCFDQSGSPLANIRVTIRVW